MLVGASNVHYGLARRFDQSAGLRQGVDLVGVEADFFENFFVVLTLACRQLGGQPAIVAAEVPWRSRDGDAAAATIGDFSGGHPALGPVRLVELGDVAQLARGDLGLIELGVE